MTGLMLAVDTSFRALEISANVVPLLFVFAFGACVGSLINVLVYRLPLGLSVVTPPSACPACGTRLTWRENIPILGWVLLRGRCRFCKSQISPEYPLVELLVAVLFGVVFALWYIVPMGDAGTWLGVPWGDIRPAWATPGRFGPVAGVPGSTLAQTWPLLVVVLLLVGGLVAMTLVDTKTYTIPLELAWIVTAAGLVGHVGLAGYLSATGATLPGTVLTAAQVALAENGDAGAVPWQWAIPTPETWAGVGLAAGGLLGLMASLVMLRTGLLRRSFADYDAWEAQHTGAPPDATAAPAPADGAAAALTEPDPAKAEPSHAGLARAVGITTLLTVGLGLLGAWAAHRFAAPGGGPAGLGVGLLAGPLLAAAILRGLAPRPAEARTSDASPVAPAGTQPDDAHDQAQLWTEYPHARREMVKELGFLGPIVGLLYLGWTLGGRLSTGGSGPGELAWSPPLWAKVAAGVVIGYLIGAGVVWAVRVLGSLAFGREAMGLGDVHLMGAVGACAGWIDASLAFFLGAFVGVYLTIVQLVRYGRVRRAMPFGPSLAIAAVLVLLAKPAIEAWLGRMMHLGGAMDLP